MGVHENDEPYDGQQVMQWRRLWLYILEREYHEAFEYIQ